MQHYRTIIHMFVPQERSAMKTSSHPVHQITGQSVSLEVATNQTMI